MENIKRYSRVLLLIFFLPLPGCMNTTPLQSYRPIKEQKNVHVGHNYFLSTIEFDDMGELFDAAQFTDTLGAIRKLKTDGWASMTNYPAGWVNGRVKEARPITLIVFVHGWKHNASDRSSNFADFKNFIAEYASVVSEVYRTNRAAPVIVGAYVGWRGALYKNTREGPGQIDLNFLPTNARFYNRKAAAERVAGPAATAAILALCGEAKADLERGLPPSRAIVIGHSLGGLIVERAVSQAVLGSLLIGRSDVNAEHARRISTQALIASLRQELEKAMTDRDELSESLEEFAPKLSDEKWVVEEQTKRRAQLDSARLALNAKEKELAHVKSALDQQVAATERHSAELESALGALEKRLLKDVNDVPAADSEKSSIRRVSLKLTDSVRRTIAEMRGGATVNAARLHKELADIASNEFDGRDSLLRRDVSSGIEAALSQADIEAKAKAREEAIELSKATTARRQAIAGQVKELTDSAQAADAAFKEAESWPDKKKSLAVLEKREKELHEEIARAEASLTKTPRAPQAADLIVLANPASEAITAKKMMDAFSHTPILTTNGYRFDRPLVVSISSEGDSATGMIFPIAMRLTSLTKKFNNRPRYDQRKYLLRTAPNVEDLHSHYITNATWLYPGHFGREANYRNILKANLSTNTTLLGRYEFGAFRKSRSPGVDSAETDTIYKYEIRPTYGNNSAYWVIKAPPEIINDHNDIFSDRFSSLITGLIRASGAFFPEDEKIH